MEELSRDLLTVRLDVPSKLDGVLPRLRAFVGLDSLLVFVPEERVTGWALDRFETDNIPNASRFASVLTGFLGRTPGPFWFFDPVAPETEQRNCAIDTAAHVGQAVYRASPIYREVLVPLHLGGLQELRALVCNGPALLGWVGGFQERTIEPSARHRLAAVLPALRQRLAADRALRLQDLTLTTIAATLDSLDEAAFVIGWHGTIAFANRAGRTRLMLDRAKTTEALLRRDPADDIDRVSIESAGMPPSTLVIFRRVAESARCEARVQRAADHWRLTRRQREVLQLIIAGRGNASIATELGIGERAVELHVTAILDRASVNSRASLVSLVLGALMLG